MSETETLPKSYEPGAVESAIYKLWLESGAFHAVPDQREQRYVVMMPLPNVTGALHMGHAMDNVMQDLLIRWHRMLGDNTLWMPGTDHAGIATQAVVEKRLKELEGLTRHDVGREGLVQRIWQWKDQYQARIIKQQQRMGCSCDWQRQRFTMDRVCARAVRHTFFQMFLDGLIYRGQRLVNWDPFLQTTISDDEVYHETVQGHFWHLRYPVLDPHPGEPEAIVVATTRPETMLGDTAVAVHPDPEGTLRARIEAAEQALAAAKADRDRDAAQTTLDALRQRESEMLPLLVRLRDMARDGRMVRLPLMDREIPLICDEWAKPELGSGCVKITPGHDPNDYNVWTRHREQIDIINILNPDGTLNERAGAYAGLDRFEARDRVVADLDQQGLLGQVEDREIELGHSDRSKTPVEPYLSDQWFVQMGDVEGGLVMGRGGPKQHQSPGLVQAAMDAVIDGRVTVHPERYAKTYLDWLSEKRDWPIGRQLWWGHRIPVWSLSGTWGELELQPVLALCDAGAAVRVTPLDDPAAHSQLLWGRDGQRDVELAAQTPCRVDVCLVQDTPEQVQGLEQIGFSRENDVLDTWFSSALWPHSTLGWPEPASAPQEQGQPPLGETGAADCLDYYYPGSCLVTGRDIITLWVARMVLAGLYNLGDIPFSDVFIHANILDGKGERMSKSKGNGIDPVDIIEAYGTDAMRYVLCDMQTGTQDIRLPVTAICPSCGHHNELGATQHGQNVFTYVCGKPLTGKKPRPDSCGQEFDVLGTMPELPAAKLISERFDVGRAFCTKLWNSARFALINLHDVPTGPRTRAELQLEDRWILDQLSRAVRQVTDGLAEYNPSAALHAAREFFWGALCDWYLELIKPRLQTADEPSGPVARQVLAFCLDQTLRLLHPFLPFITEHLWQRLGQQVPTRGLGPELAEAPPSAQLIGAAFPAARPELQDDALAASFADLQALTRAVREVRAAQGLGPRQPLRVTLKVAAERAAAMDQQARAVVARLAAIEPLEVSPDATREPGSASRVMGDLTIFVHDVIDDDAERQRLQQSLAKADKEIGVCERKLGNPKFVDRAPAEVVQEQRDRLAEYQATRQALLESLRQLEG